MNFKPDNFQTKVLSEFNQGNKEVAISKLKKYLVINPKDINARLNLAYMYINFNLIHKAIYEYEHILKKSQNLQAMFNLAICFSRLEKFRKCENLLKKVIKIDKNHFKAYRALSDIYFNLNNLEKALKFLKLAKQLVPDDPILLNILGAVEMKRGNYKIAEKYFLECIRVKKNNKSALNNLAALYQKIGKADKSLKIFNELMIKFPNDHSLLNNIGNVFIDLNRYEDAIKHLKNAIKMYPSQSSYFSNLGRALFFYKKYKNAEEKIKESLILNPNNYEAHLILFYLLIIKNDLKKAWQHFDSRLRVKHYFIPKNLNLLRSVKNKKILVLREAGLGDEILYSSMYSELIKENNRVVIECDQRLKNIFRRSFNYNNFISQSLTLKNKSNFNKFDISIYAGSLSGIFRKKLSDFNYKYYLKPDEKYVEFYKRKLRKLNHLPKIGISWISSRLDLGKDKSIELEELLPILKRKNLSFINLQYGDFTKTINYFNKKHRLTIIDMPELDKFYDIEKLLALISGLDLVLTVSNTTAHLAGSVGKKTFLLAPDNRAQLFYWMLSRNKSPWYPSIQIFKKNINWNEALRNIQLNLNRAFKD